MPDGCSRTVISIPGRVQNRDAFTKAACDQRICCYGFMEIVSDKALNQETICSKPLAKASNKPIPASSICKKQKY
jgi:hypothetical protein